MNLFGEKGFTSKVILQSPHYISLDVRRLGETLL